MITNLNTYSEAEIQRWLHIRAIEWTGWPAFVTQPIIPILLIYFPLLSVVIALFIADFFWRFIRYSFVSPDLVDIGALFTVFLKWPSAIGATIYFLLHQQYVLSLVALFWPIIAGFISFPVDMLVSAFQRHPLVGRVEVELAKRVGYVSKDTVL
ncbi:MAG: hypothetical protein ABSC53_13670 [Bacteroidota bacterium]